MIYLVEDSGPKAERIVDFLHQHSPDASLQTLGSYHSALEAIERRCPDVLLLDMSLPNFDRGPNRREGRLRALGGYEIMRKLRLRNLTPKVIVVSQLEEFGEGEERITFPEVTEKCASEFPSIFVGSVYFGQGSNSTWPTELSALLGNISRNGG